MILIETERLELCYMSEADAPFMLQLLNMPSYYKFIGDRGVRTIEQAEEYIRERALKFYKKFGFNYYIIQLKTDHRPIGMVGLMKRDTLEYVDIGYALLENQAGKGYGVEAASGLMRWAIETKGITTFSGIVQDNNPASIRVLEKLGMQLDRKIIMDDEELLLYVVRK